jgi:hypothetical protein
VPKWNLFNSQFVTLTFFLDTSVMKKKVFKNFILCWLCWAIFILILPVPFRSNLVPSQTISSPASLFGFKFILDRARTLNKNLLYKCLKPPRGSDRPQQKLTWAGRRLLWRCCYVFSEPSSKISSKSLSHFHSIPPG